MTLSAQAREYMDKRDMLTKIESELIDYTFTCMREIAEEDGIRAATDDRAAELEAAMIKFILDSRE